MPGIDFGILMLRLAEGFGTTVGLFALTLVCSLPLGLLVSFGLTTKFKPLSILTNIFVWVIRGTPLLLQLFVIYIGLPYLGIRFDEFNSAACAFIINYAAYFAVIFKGGILGIPRGQFEAGKVLGLKGSQCFRRVILPQVGKNVLAPISNEVITLVKDTSLASSIAVVEITKTAQGISMQFGNILPLFYSGIFYLLFNGILTIVFGLAEKKLNYYR